jgi:hypothetical protein
VVAAAVRLGDLVLDGEDILRAEERSRSERE